MPTAAPPAVGCVWQLPDVDQNPDNGVQYGQDADPSGADEPCGGAQMMHMKTDVNTAGRQLIDFFATANDPNGNADIIGMFVTVWSPPTDGKCLTNPAETPLPRPHPIVANPSSSHHEGDMFCHGFELAGALLPCTPRDASISTGHYLHAAINTGQSTQAQANATACRVAVPATPIPAPLSSQTVELTSQGEFAVWKASGVLDGGQPCGRYHVETTVVDKAGLRATRAGDFTVLCVLGLRFDFSGIQWGEISPGVTKLLLGDADMSTPERPSILNTGQVPLLLEVRFGPMTGKQHGAKITSFGAAWNGMHESQIGVEVPHCFHTAMPLLPNQTAPLDLEVHPQVPLPADLYTGSIEVIGRETC
jgi:hypothetical protein